MLDKVALKRSTFLVENKLKNGDFRYGFDGWTRNGTGTLAINENVLNYQLSNISSSEGVTLRENINENDKYFLSFDINPFRTHVPSIWIGGLKSLDIQAQKGVFTKVYTVFVAPESRSNIVFYVNGATSSGMEVGLSTSFKNFALINMTEVFGAGNEPTAKQMDVLLSQFNNGWFYGTQNVFNAEYMLKMYFNKMRELDNAITSLGGSV